MPRAAWTGGAGAVRFACVALLALAVSAGAMPRARAPRAATPPARAHPNVLFLLADDMRADSIRALGNRDVCTPALDSLVARGFVLRNAYCLGGNSAAVCTPSRNMLLSGKAYFRWRDFTPPDGKGKKGSLAPGDGPNLPLSFRDGGYATYHHGKRGNTAPLIQARFETDRYLGDDERERRSGEPGREIVDAAIEFLRARRGRDARPFLMYLAFANPHDPRVAAPEYRALYRPEALALPRNFRPLHPFDNGEMTVRDEALLPWPRTEADIRRTLHEYYATVSGLDRHIGRLLAALGELGLLDDTLVVFSADQGIALGSHGLLGKQSLYDAAMKAPLVFAGPGIPRGESQALVYLLDVYPTLCGLVGLPAPPGIDGKSFADVLTRGAPGRRRALLLAYRDVQRALREERWKLVRYPQVDLTQLFDLAADPDEVQDRAADPAEQPRVHRMLERLGRLQAELGDTQPLRVERPKPAAWQPPGAARNGK